MKTEINAIISTSGKVIPFCRWQENEDGVWHTSCNGLYEITEGTPEENDMQFCCYCGKRIEQHIFQRRAE